MELFKYIRIIIRLLLEGLRYFYFVFLPLAYMSYLIYIRLILDRPTRDITQAISNFRIFIIISIIVVLVLRIKSLLILEDLITLKESKNVVMVKFKLFAKHLSDYYESFLENCYETMVGIRLRMYFTILIFVRFLYKIPIKQESTMLLIGLEILPKAVVVISFIIDIFIFKEIHYFYKTVGLLLLPLFSRIITYVITKFREQHAESMIKLITSEPLLGTDYDTFCFIDPTLSYAFIKNVDDFINNHFCPIYDITYILILHRSIRSKYQFKKIEIIISLLYIIGWTTILIFGIKF